MAAVSVGKAWQEAVAFVAREATLLFPVALLFVALPGLIIQEMTPPELTAWSLAPTATLPAVPPGFAVAMLIAIILIWFGSLTLFALALRPGISVGEALRLSLARLPVLLGTVLAVVAILMAIILVAVLVAVALSFLSKTLGATLGLLLGVGVAGFAIFASIRLLLLNPVVIDGDAGVLASLRQSWALTRGHFWRIFGFLIVLTLLSAIASTAAQSIVGVLARVAGGPDTARFAGGVAAAAVSTVIQVYMLAMIARFYRQAVAG